MTPISRVYYGPPWPFDSESEMLEPSLYKCIGTIREAHFLHEGGNPWLIKRPVHTSLPLLSAFLPRNFGLGFVITDGEVEQRLGRSDQKFDEHSYILHAHYFAAATILSTGIVFENGVAYDMAKGNSARSTPWTWAHKVAR